MGEAMKTLLFTSLAILLAKPAGLRCRLPWIPRSVLPASSTMAFNRCSLWKLEAFWQRGWN
jgi:hypothetical protein